MNHAPFTGWRTSSHSGNNGNCVEVALSGWRKSSHSDANGNCVEVGDGDGLVGVRDSKQDGAGPVLAFTAAEWTAFTRAVKDGEFDR